jgi:hypothetical protein
VAEHSEIGSHGRDEQTTARKPVVVMDTGWEIVSAEHSVKLAVFQRRRTPPKFDALALNFQEEMFCISKKSPTFASRLLYKFTKSLVLSALLLLVSVARMMLGICFLIY